MPLAGEAEHMEKQINLALAALNAISILFLLQINIGIIPLVQSSLPRDRADKINMLVADLSQGVLVSTFFYLLLVKLPEGTKAKKVKALISPKLSTIVSQMEISIHYLVQKYGLEAEDITRISRDQLSTIAGLDGEPMNFRYQIIGRDGRVIPFSTGAMTDIQHFEQERVLVERLIDEILALPHIADEDSGFVDLLPRLRDCNLYSSVRVYSQYGKAVSSPDFSTYVYDYLRLYSKLRKEIGPGVCINPVKDPDKLPC
jgi:hypothetical protein